MGWLKLYSAEGGVQPFPIVWMYTPGVDLHSGARITSRSLSRLSARVRMAGLPCAG